MILRSLTLRLRIFLAMLALILVSFLLTGTITIYHFKQENELYHQERLKRKEYAIHESIDYFLKQQSLARGGVRDADSLVSLFDTKICELAEIHNLDINIYGLRGNLLISSRPELYEQGVVPEKLDSNTLHALQEANIPLLRRTQVDSAQYLSTYAYIRNGQGRPMAVINLPYFRDNTFHEEELEEFLKTLAQIYLVLFLAAGWVAYFLSNYITGSLVAISERLKSLRLAAVNEPLHWQARDEIGDLVEEYNKMLEVLQESAVRLARTERESAWKEMAKQVAHEIKNPLTPMRLNVQHLQRSLKTEDPARLKEFCETMIGQIDTLGRIAEAFSRFALLPEFRLTPLSVPEVVKQAVDLYPDLNVKLEVGKGDLTAEADREQLIRVMNNLLSNALQAVPDDREPRIEVKIRRQMEEVWVEVKDNGTGIPEDQRNKIFEPSFTTKTKGMGLGLAMVRQIVEAFRGRIWFESRQGEGTSFFLALPPVRPKEND